MTLRQISLNLEANHQQPQGTIREKLFALLSDNLDFHTQKSNGKSHSFHSFPAKFPPQLPRKFISGLTNEGDIVLDPMSGSGTTLVETFWSRRNGIAFDIDPLALKISSTKIRYINVDIAGTTARNILENAKLAVQDENQSSREIFLSRWDEKTISFVNYWFSERAQLELSALMLEIEKIEDRGLRSFFELAFSAVIVTKSGGVSMALDLAHTRPHRAKIVIDVTGEKIFDESVKESRKPFLTKKLRSVFVEFEKRCKSNINGLVHSNGKGVFGNSLFGNAEAIPLPNNIIDLIVTSPPYASNAIDYMRAHKFSLVWMGYLIEELGNKRKEYIGGDALSNFLFENMPANTLALLNKIAGEDRKKGKVVHRYYSEMTRVLKEMFRVLKSGKSAIVVVGSSVIRGIDTETHLCLAEIGKEIGFEVPKIGERNLDRNRRMMPAGLRVDKTSQIQQRIHKEYIIGFYKP